MRYIINNVTVFDGTGTPSVPATVIVKPTNARDLSHFVELFGYTPCEALAAATRHGAELMIMQDGRLYKAPQRMRDAA